MLKMIWVRLSFFNRGCDIGFRPGTYEYELKTVSDAKDGVLELIYSELVYLGLILQGASSMLY